MQDLNIVAQLCRPMQNLNTLVTEIGRHLLRRMGRSIIVHEQKFLAHLDSLWDNNRFHYIHVVNLRSYAELDLYELGSFPQDEFLATPQLSRLGMNRPLEGAG